MIYHCLYTGLIVNTYDNHDHHILSAMFSVPPQHQATAGCLSFHPLAQCVVHALKAHACRAPVLLAPAEVTKHNIFSMDPMLRHPAVQLKVYSIQHTYNTAVKSRTKLYEHKLYLNQAQLYKEIRHILNT